MPRLFGQHTLKKTILYIFIFLLSSCITTPKGSSLFPREKEAETEKYDLDEIIDAGTIIVGTLSGPDSYYEMGDEPMGLEFALAQDFASSIGVSIRIELSKSEEQLLDKLQRGEIDLAAYPLSQDMLQSKGLKDVLIRDSVKHLSWAVSADCSQLAEALGKWSVPTHEKDVISHERLRLENTVTRIPRPQFLSREQGVLSNYDNIFRDAAHATGSDWRLLAAVAYVESRYDPMARSSAGAQGIMQLMPGTARSLGVDNPSDPTQNINGGARLLRTLTSQYADVRNPDERLKFVLASYNAGAGHVRDAMLLARKHGKNPHNWTDVSEFILHLSEPQYYRDPIVRHGYMRGTETYNYVPGVLSIYRDYGGRVAFMPGTFNADESEEGKRKAAPNRFTRGTRIISADDSTFTSGR